MNKKTTTKLAAVTEVEKFTKTVVTISALYVPRWLFITSYPTWATGKIVESYCHLRHSAWSRIH